MRWPALTLVTVGLLAGSAAHAGDGRPSQRAFEEQWHAKGKSLTLTARWLGDRRILVVRDAVNGALDTLPYSLDERSEIGPPAGRARALDGWAVPCRVCRPQHHVGERRLG